jgi:glycosyltransferase involved in cell wall biosynthesis
VDLAIIVPMLRRAHRVKPLLESIRGTCDARVVFAVTPDDSAVIEALRGEETIVVPWEPRGDYARKCNQGVAHTTEPLLFFAADDLLFHPGWFEAATAKLTPGIGVVGTNDLGNPRVIRGRHATHCLVTRDYIVQHGTIDESGKVMHEGYVHEFVDDELVGTAIRRRAWAFAKDSHVEHLHPHWGKCVTDELYDAQAARLKASRPLFRQREKLWT